MSDSDTPTSDADEVATQRPGENDTLRFVGPVAIVAAVVVVTWIVVGWPLRSNGCIDDFLSRASNVGDALGPIVGALSITAVLVALRSLAFQRESLGVQRRELGLQREELKLQRAEFARQTDALDLQAKELKAQHDALSAQLSFQRQTALRDAYAELIAKFRAYAAVVAAYREWLLNNPDRDKGARQHEQQLVEREYATLDHATWPVDLLDGDRERADMRAAMTRKVWPLESRHDTPEGQTVYMMRIEYELALRRSAMYELIRSLRGELGIPRAEHSPDEEKDAETISRWMDVAPDID